MKLHAHVLGSLLPLLLLGGACGDGSEGFGSGGDDGQSPGGACQVNVTKSCSCNDDLKGRQVCRQDGWEVCMCQTEDGEVVVGPPGSGLLPGGSVPAGNLRSDIEFEWERTAAQAGSCEPGRYTGDFMGLYSSQLTFINFPIPVFALGQPGRPGLAFTLEKKGSGEQLEIRDGVMEGTADGFFPFRGTLTGSLDCQTGEFNAILSGFYSLGVEGVGMFKFEGPLTGKYDKVAHEIQMGTWDVEEYDPPPVLPGAGGIGNWFATWDGP